MCVNLMNDEMILYCSYCSCFSLLLCWYEYYSQREYVNGGWWMCVLCVCFFSQFVLQCFCSVREAIWVNCKYDSISIYKPSKVIRKECGNFACCSHYSMDSEFTFVSCSCNWRFFVFVFVQNFATANQTEQISINDFVDLQCKSC